MTEFENTVSVPREELEELKRQAEEINQRLKELSAPKYISPYVTVKPLSCPRNLKDGEPVFGYTNRPDPEAWNTFIRLAKIVHTKSPQFYMSTNWPGGTRPYIRSTSEETPRRIEQLSVEQVKISAEMLNEMIAVYNRYFLMLHERIVYDPRDGSGPQIVEVQPPRNEEE